MSLISLPKPIAYEVESPSKAKVVIEPLFPGYGTTIGNVIRRVLLSSLDGVAVSAIKVAGIEHEFTGIAHVKEDAIELIQNIKRIRLKAKTAAQSGEGEGSDEPSAPLTMSLSAAGETVVKAGDIKAPPELEIVNKTQVIATLTDAAAKLEVEMLVSHGIGYVTADNQQREDTDVGWIDIDSIYTPLVKVGLDVTEVRVGKMTNYHKLILDIETDGTRTPEGAVHQALDIILEQLNFLREGESDESHTEDTASSEAADIEGTKEEQPEEAES